MSEDELRDAVLLVFANKQDLPCAMQPSEVAGALGLNDLPMSRLWHLQPASAVTGLGLHEGLGWLSSALNIGASPPKRKSTVFASDIHKSRPGGLTLIPKGYNDANSVATETDSDSSHVSDMDTLFRCSYAVVKLDPKDHAVVEEALERASTYLQTQRDATRPSDYVKEEFYEDNLELFEAHWPKERSQLRLLESPTTSSSRLATNSQSALWETGEPPVSTLRQAQMVLSTVASSFVGDGNVLPEQLASRSALDVFYYFDDTSSSSHNRQRSQFACPCHTDGCSLTILAANAPGLEVKDSSTNQWLPLDLESGEVAVLVGRTASAYGIENIAACEHRVRRPVRGSTRTSISLDVYYKTPLSGKTTGVLGLK